MKEKKFSIDAYYHARNVSTHTPGEHIEKIKNSSLKILAQIVKAFDESLDLENADALEKAIENRKKDQEKSEQEIKKMTSKNPAKEIALNRVKEKQRVRQNQIKVLEDYNTLKALREFHIPGAKEPYFEL